MRIKTILVPTDLSEASERAIDYASQLAHKFEATIHLLYVVEIPIMVDPMPGGVMWAYPSPTVVDEAQQSLEEIRHRLGLDARATVEKGIPSDTIVAYAQAEHVDLIVMATHGRRGLSRVLMGSTTESVLRKAPCPVLTLRPATLETVDEADEQVVSLHPKT